MVQNVGGRLGFFVYEHTVLFSSRITSVKLPFETLLRTLLTTPLLRLKTLWKASILHTSMFAFPFPIIRTVLVRKKQLILIQ